MVGLGLRAHQKRRFRLHERMSFEVMFSVEIIELLLVMGTRKLSADDSGRGVLLDQKVSCDRLGALQLK